MAKDVTIAPARNGLNDRDILILKGLGLNRTTEQIADTLKCSPKTVEYHISGTQNSISLYRKLGVGSRAALVRYAVESGLVKPGETALPEHKPAKLSLLEVNSVETLKQAILRGANLAANNQADVLQTNALCQCSDAYIRVARFQIENT